MISCIEQKVKTILTAWPDLILLFTSIIHFVGIMLSLVSVTDLSNHFCFVVFSKLVR